MSFVRVRGHQVHVQELGEGDRPVVFVHGMLMDNLASWYFTVANQVAQSARVILYDLRGHGRSEQTPDGYRVADLVEDLDGLLDALEIEGPVVLVGNSFGGLVALAYTIAHPERVEGLAMIDGNLHDEHWNEDIATRFASSDASLKRRDAEVWKYAHRYAGLKSPRKRNQLGRAAHRLVFKTTFVDDLSRTDPLEEGDLEAIGCPVLTLYGADSELTERARSMVSALPDVEAHWFPGHTHLLLWEATAEVRDRLMDWLRRLD